MTNLIKLLPPSLRADSFVIACAEAFEKQLLQLREEFNEVCDLISLTTQNEQLIDLLAYEKYIEFYSELTLEEKRDTVKKALSIHTKKGTKAALEMILEILNLDGLVEEWFQYGGEPGYFKLAIYLEDRGLTAEVLQVLERMINDYKRNSSWLDDIYIFVISGGDLSYSASIQTSETIEIEPWEDEHE